MRIMDRIVSDLHLGRRPIVNRVYAGLRRRGYVVLRDTSQTSLYWVNGSRFTAYQLVAFALRNGVRLSVRRR